MKISYDTCLRTRGIAILGIVIHNFVHLLPGRYVPENELCFSIANPMRLVRELCEMKPAAIGSLFSFFGWYGVAVFVFLSGYGLAAKYEVNGGSGYRWGCHLVRSTIKLLLLVLPPYLLYLAAVHLFGHPDAVPNAKGFPIIANLIYPFQYPDPGVYWYVGLAIQLYVVYGVFFRFRCLFVPIVVICASIGAMMGADPVLTGSQNPIVFLRANFLGWLPVFVSGILVARGCPQTGRMLTRAEIACCLVVSALLLYAFSFEYHLWLVSTFPAVLMAISMASLLPRMHFSRLGAAMSWLGGLSATVFVVHPLVRYCFLWHIPDIDESAMPWIVSGVVSSVVVAWTYSWCRRYMSAMVRRVVLI